MEDVIGKEVMTLSLLSNWVLKQASSNSDMDSLFEFNSWLEKVQLASRPGGMPPGNPPRPGLKWKPETHRWIRPEEEDIREEKKQPRLQEIQDYVETGGFGEIAEKTESMLLDLFPDMLNPEQITRIKKLESIQEKEQRKKYKDRGMTYKEFTDIVGGRVSFHNVNEVMDGVKLLQEKAEELGFRIVEESNRMEKPLDGYYRRYHMDIEMDTEDGKTITVELQLGTANQTKIADWAHDLLHKKGKDRPILSSNDRRTAFQYVTQMSELYAYHDGVEGAKNIYPADCIEVIRKFAGCLDVPES